MPTFEVRVRDSAERVFRRIADVRHYDDWLGRSGAYKGTTDVSPGPIAEGTTYVESDPTGVRHGPIVELTEFSRIRFSQPMTMRAGLGRLGIEQQIDVTPDGDGDGVRVRRSLDFAPQGAMRILFPLLWPFFKRENERIMRALAASGD